MNCPLCAAPLGDVLLAISEPDRFERAAGIRPAGYLREWRDCHSCGAAVNVRPAVSADAWRKLSTNYYEVDFGGGSLREKYDRVMALAPAASDNAGRVARIRQFLGGQPSGRVLDIGAGLGVFLGRFLRDGWQGVAIEPDPLAAAHLRSLQRFEVVQGLFSNGTSLGTFDLVTLNKVIEHIDNPLSLLAAAGRALAQAGVIYVEVPDRETIGRRPHTDNILGSAHAHLHSPQSLGGLLARAGLFPLHIGRVAEPSGKLTVFAFAVAKTGLDARYQ